MRDRLEYMRDAFTRRVRSAFHSPRPSGTRVGQWGMEGESL
jgi:hypothetical protein